jgi:hypothetical protein
VLDAMAGNPFLGPRLVLHGGTALNVFHSDLPRLSVDIDVAYVGSADLSVTQRERPSVDEEIRRLAAKLGYETRSLHNEHAGQSYRLRYDTGYVKVDINYLDRVPLLDPVVMACPVCRPSVSFAVRPLLEVLAGKVSALVDRTAPRDLYDIYRMVAESAAPALDSGLARGLVLHAVSLTNRFPFEHDLRQALVRLGVPTPAQRDELRVVLGTEDVPDFEEMRRVAGDFFGALETLTVEEAKYVRLLGECADYRPDLILPEPVAARALTSPVSRWKVQNLRIALDADGGTATASGPGPAK